MKEAQLKKLLHTWLEYQFLSQEMPGFSVEVRMGKRVLYKKTFGYANVGKKEKLGQEHVFPLASHSKMLTSTLIMREAEKGNLHLDDKLSNYLDIKGTRDRRVKEVTIRQLMSHSAGVMRDGPRSTHWLYEKEFLSQEEVLEALECGLLLENNTGFKYSNIGYGLLGMVLEKVTGKIYKKLLQETFPRVGLLGGTTPLVTGYGKKEVLGPRAVFDMNVSTKDLAPATGVCGNTSAILDTVENLYFRNEAVVSDEGKKELFRQSWSTNDNEESSYGLGFVRTSLGKRALVGHGGGFVGAVSRTLFDPKDHVAVALCTNTLHIPLLGMARGIFGMINMYYDHRKDNSTDSNLEGAYYGIWGDTYLLDFGEKLHFLPLASLEPTKEEDICEKEGADRYRATVTNDYFTSRELLEVIRDDGKNVKELRLAGGMVTYYPRKEYVRRIKTMD